MSYNVFISLPMNGREDLEIWKDIERIKTNIKPKLMNVAGVITFIDNMSPTIKSVLDGNWRQERLFYLGSAIAKLGRCDVCVFGKGWETAKGCKIEHAVCEAYGIKILYEEEPEEVS